MGVKKVVTIATEEFVLNLLNTMNNEFPDKKFNQLETSNKTILGAINEVNELLGMFVAPEYDVTAQMYYGVVNPEDLAGMESFGDITEDMINNENIISTKPGERTSIPLGYVEQGQFIVIAIPVIFDLVATKDDGFGNTMAFDDSVLGANGIDVTLNGQDYLIYGEFILVSGNRYINITKRIPIDVDSGCQCPPVTDEDITNIIDSLE